MRYHLTHVRMAMIKKTRNKKHWRACGEKGTSQKLLRLETDAGTLENSM